MTGRFHFRRGTYHYKPVVLEYGRKIVSHLFKRNNYQTFLVGKDQPVRVSYGTNNEDETDHFYTEGPKFWGFDKSFTSSSGFYVISLVLMSTLLLKS